jgi:hypothetical protein
MMGRYHTIFVSIIKGNGYMKSFTLTKSGKDVCLKALFTPTCSLKLKKVGELIRP